MVQPAAADGPLGDPVANGQGFLARFPMVRSERAIGTRLRVGHDRASDTALAAFGNRIGDLLRRPLPPRDGTSNELAPPVPTLSPGSRAVLRDFALKVEAAQGPWRSLETVRSFASMAAEQAARLPAVLTLAGDPGAVAIRAESMAEAVTLVSWYPDEALRPRSSATVSQGIAEAERMQRWLLGPSWEDPLISAIDAARRGPFKETAKAKKALAVLEDHGWLFRLPEGGEVLGRRRREVWRIVREGAHGVPV